MLLQIQVSKDRELSICGGRQHVRPVIPTHKVHPELHPILWSWNLESQTVAEPSADPVKQKGYSRTLGMHQERRFGSFKRAWNLPEDADASSIFASVQQGVLVVKVQKKKPAETELTDIPVH